MRGGDISLLKLFNSAMTRFIIPVYQRNYDWKIANCKRLFDDLIALSKSKREGHFFGCIVSVDNPAGYSNERVIIDGQQRVTTVSLLLLAIYRLLKKGEQASSNSQMARMIYTCYLVDSDGSDEIKLKLKPVKNDCKAYSRLFHDESEFVRDSNLTINFNYFITRLREKEITVDELFNAISRLLVIYVELKQDDDPQLVFESLNSTGLALSEGDKIRNFVLMGVGAAEQERLYEKYWNPIEVSVGDVSAFVRDYLSVKKSAIQKQNQVYFAFKDYLKYLSCSSEQILSELWEYAKLYRMLLIGETGNRELDACIGRLNRIETTVARPFFLEVLGLHRDGGIGITAVLDIFLTVEAFVFRRTICELPTSALNKVFLSLHREIKRLDGSLTNYVAKFKFVLCSKQGRMEFPCDSDFFKLFQERNVYKMSSKTRMYVLDRLENFGTNETQDVYGRVDDGRLSIEHIMPQNLTAEWISTIGSDYKVVHETWLHRVANLTLTAYNQKYSNSPFADKVNMKDGFRDSHIWLNRWVSQQEEWGERQLSERSRMLAERALEIWPFPKADDFRPYTKPMDSASLGEEVVFMGRSISAFSFKGAPEQPVKNWIDMFVQVIRQLHFDDKSILVKVAASDATDFISKQFSCESGKLRDATEVDNDLFVERNTSTETKIAILRKVFDLFDIEYDELIFFFKAKQGVRKES